jgi:hypothetical protein
MASRSGEVTNWRSDQAFLYADSEDKFNYLPKLIVGLVFLGSPFRGTTWQYLAASIAQLMRPAGSHDGIIKQLGYDEPALLDKLHDFYRLRNRLLTPVTCFYELFETDYGSRFPLGGLAKGMVCCQSAVTLSSGSSHLIGCERVIRVHSRPRSHFSPDGPLETEQILRPRRSIVCQRLNRDLRDERQCTGSYPTSEAPYVPEALRRCGRS